MITTESEPISPRGWKNPTKAEFLIKTGGCLVIGVFIVSAIVIGLCLALGIN